MAILSTNNPTLLDLAKRLDPQGNIDTIVEILNETNEVLEEMTWLEGNLPTGHRTTIRSGLPEPTWRRLYGGVQPTKSTTVQVTDNTGMLEAYAEVDKALADLNNNTAEFRLSEDRPHIEAISQEIARAVFYASETANPEQITGLSPRYSDLSAENADNIIDAGGAQSDNASIWLVVWGPNTVHGIVPKGSTAGLQMEDKGQVTIEDVDGDGGRMEAYRTHYRFDAGVSLRDWRYAVRIANIDRGDLVVDPGDGEIILSDLMFEAMEHIPNLGAGRATFYMDRRIRTFLRMQSSKQVKNSTLTIEQIGGVQLMSFHGIPVRRVDVLDTDEAEVT